jgi:hypothetical protein
LHKAGENILLDLQDEKLNTNAQHSAEIAAIEE